MIAYTPEIIASTATTAGILTVGAARAAYRQISQAVENLAERLMQKQTSQDRAKSSCTGGYICSTGSKRQDLHTTPPAIEAKEATAGATKTLAASHRSPFLFTWKNQKRTGRLLAQPSYSLLQAALAVWTLADAIKEATRTGSKLFPASHRSLFLRGALFLYRIQAFLGTFFYLSGLEGYYPPVNPLKQPRIAQKQPRIGVYLPAEL